MNETAIAGNERILAILHALVTRGDPSGVRELAHSLGASRSTVSRVLLGLVEHGLASTTVQGNYTVGPRLQVLGAALHERHPLLRSAASVVELLAEQSDSTVLTAVYDAPRPQAIVVVSRRRPGPVKYLLEPGTIVPLHAGATGRSILARVGLPALGDEPLDSRTVETVTDRAEIEKLLIQDRRAGYTISVGQQIPLAAGVAAPFQCLSLTGSVSITRPRYLTSDEDLLSLGPAVLQAASDIEAVCRTQPTFRHEEPITYPDGASALERIIRIITALVSVPTGINAGRILARRIDANIATTNRLVSNLTASGIAVVDASQLLPGPRLLHWAACLGPHVDLPAAARHILTDLAERTGETIGLVQFDEESMEAEMTTVIDGVRPLHYGLASGVPIPLYAGAAGKAILAFCPSDKVSGLALQPLTERTHTDLPGLTADLQTIRERGWATGNGERIPDAFGVSAPYFVSERVAGSITATVARIRLPDIDVKVLADAVQDAAHRLTRLLTVG